jgi:hypothetical protein
MTATKAVTRGKAKPAPKDAIALLKADHKAVSEMYDAKVKVLSSQAARTQGETT